MVVDSDEDIIRLMDKILLQKEKVNYLENVIKRYLLPVVFFAFFFPNR